MPASLAEASPSRTRPSILPYSSADRVALKQFAQEAKLRRGTRKNRVTYAHKWEEPASLSGEIFVYKEGSTIIAVMHVQVVDVDFNDQQVLLLDRIESIRKDAGLALMKSAAERVLRENLGGIVGDPDATALRLYKQYQPEEFQFGRYFLSADKLQKLLDDLNQ